MRLGTIHKIGSLAVVLLALSFCVFVWNVYFAGCKMPLFYVCIGLFVIGVILLVVHFWTWNDYIDDHSVWPGDGLS